MRLFFPFLMPILLFSIHAKAQEVIKIKKDKYEKASHALLGSWVNSTTKTPNCPKEFKDTLSFHLGYTFQWNSCGIKTFGNWEWTGDKMIRLYNRLTQGGDGELADLFLRVSELDEKNIRFSAGTNVAIYNKINK